MIRFFRKLRLQFLSRNQFNKYLLYALGEIILVVVGILIALQINNWNEHRKTQILEQQILHALLEEFKLNLARLDEIGQTNLGIIEACRSIGAFTGPSSMAIDEKQFSNLMRDAFKYEARYIPVQGAINEIINSGRLTVLSNQELRNELTSWQSAYELVKIQEDQVVNQQSIAHDYFLNNGNFRRHLYIIDDPLIDVKPSRFPNNNFRFLNDLSFESYLYSFIVYSQNLQKSFYDPLRDRILKILELLKKEIKNG